MVECPICRKAVEPRSKNAGFPFCSQRCRQVDLGRWLDEGYRVAAEPADLELPTDEEQP
jgi:endogenous inhibitor of DNA gyrase (YacG/DUF329 family)